MIILVMLIVIFSIWVIVKSVEQIKLQAGIPKLYPGYKMIKLADGYIGYSDDDTFVYVESKNPDDGFKFEMEHIDSYEVYCDNLVVSKGSRALVGGLAFGTVGAIAGGVSGNAKIKEMGIRLYVDGRYIKANFLAIPCKKSSHIAELADKQLHQFISMLKKGR